MGRGRKAAPTAVKIARGTARKNPSRISQVEPDSPAGKPRKPAYIKGRAARQWYVISRALEAMQVLTISHGPMLEAYCQAYGRWREAEDDIEENGIVVIDEKGRRKRNQACVDSHTYHAEMFKWLTEMGMTPSSKQKVTSRDVEKTKKASTWSEFLKAERRG